MYNKQAAIGLPNIYTGTQVDELTIICLNVLHKQEQIILNIRFHQMHMHCVSVSTGEKGTLQKRI
jgi:hypothetical protein